MNEQQMNDVTTHAHSGMGGLIMGIHVLPAAGTVVGEVSKTERSLTLIAREQPNRFGKLPGKAFVLFEKNSVPGEEKISIPGPLIVLNRNEPVNINILNKLVRLQPFIGMAWKLKVILTVLPDGVIIRRNWRHWYYPDHPLLLA